MGEFGRIFYNKIMLIILVALLLLNGMLYVKNESDSRTEWYSVYEEELEQCRDMPYEELTAYIEERLFTSDEASAGAYEALRTEADYIEGFSKRYETMVENAGLMEKVGSFGGKDSFSARNAKKTLKDYKAFTDIEVSLGNGQTVKSLVENRLTDYILMGFMLVIVMFFVRERKLGLWGIVHSCKRGRFSLAADRAVILPAGAVIGSVILYGENIILGFAMYGDIGDVGRSIQSVYEFSGCVYPVTIAGYFGFHILMKAFSAVAIGFIMWLIVSAIDNITPSLALLAIFFAGEYFWYSSLQIQSNLNVLKFLNIFSVMAVNDEYLNYLNININEQPVNTFLIGMVSGAVLLLGTGALSVVINTKKHTVRADGRLRSLWNRPVQKIRVLRGSVHIIFTEVYKLLIMQKGILILPVLWALCFSQISQAEYLMTLEGTVEMAYYEELEGSITEEKLTFLENERSRITEIFEQGQSNPYIVAQDNTIKRLEETIEEYKRLKEEKGIEIRFVNEFGYRSLFGTDENNEKMIYGVEALLFAVLLVSTLFSVENRNGAAMIVRSTKKGRGAVLRTKLLLVAIMSLVVTGSIYAVEFYNATYSFGISSLDAPIQSLAFFRNFPMNISIFGFLVLLYVIRFLCVFSVGCTALLVSCYAKGNTDAVLLSLLLLCVPSVLTYIGIEPLKYISPAYAITLVNLWSGSDFTGVLWYLPIVAIFCVGTFSVFMVNKKWKNK